MAISRLFKISIILISSLFISPIALGNSIKSIPSVSKLKNIQTTDWEYRALKSLAKRYDCIHQWQQGNNTRPITRFEFAVGLNSCLQQIENLTSSQDLILWQRLQRDFAPELTRLTNKVEQLETKVAQIESQQFSTTTKFEGQVLFFLTDSFGGDDNSETTFGYRTRLNFNTSFSGKDLLRVRLENRNSPRLDDVTNTSLSRLSVDGDTDGLTELSELSYTFPVAENTEILFGTAGVSLNDLGEVLNPFLVAVVGRFLALAEEIQRLYALLVGRELALDKNLAIAFGDLQATLLTMKMLLIPKQVGVLEVQIARSLN